VNSLGGGMKFGCDVPRGGRRGEREEGVIADPRKYDAWPPPPYQRRGKVPLGRIFTTNDGEVSQGLGVRQPLQRTSGGLFAGALHLVSGNGVREYFQSNRAAKVARNELKSRDRYEQVQRVERTHGRGDFAKQLVVHSAPPPFPPFRPDQHQ